MTGRSRAGALAAGGLAALLLAPGSIGDLRAAPVLPAAPAADTAFDAGRAGFRMLVRGVEIPYRVFMVSARPGEDVLIRVLAHGGDSANVG